MLHIQGRDEANLPCFLDLPRSIRRRIYILAGLVRVCPISFNTEGQDKREYLQECQEWCFDSIDPPVIDFNTQAGWRCFYRRKRFMDETINATLEGFDCVCKPLPTALLLVSHRIYDEVSSILFSENTFRVCRSDRRSLSALLMLRPSALQSMTSLSIRLNACSCIPHHQCPEQRDLDKSCPKCHFNCKLGRDFPTSVTQLGGQALISEWTFIAKRLARYITPSQLRLSIICDTLDYVTGEHIAETLLELPQLRECALRLGQAPDPSLHGLCEGTVLQLTSRPTYYHRHNSFPFSELPEEVQRQILGYTDLVCPEAIVWTGGYGLERSSCCMRCTDALEACCCSVLHAAYSSNLCSCWAMPSAIFSINRRLHEYAIEIFFSKNTFKLYPGDPEPESDSRYLLRFLQAIPQRALMYIRSIHLIFEGLDYHILGPGKVFQKNWNSTVEFISRNLKLPQLCLTIEDHGSRFGGSVENLTTGRDDSAEVEDLEWIMYQRLAEPLESLGCLRALYIHFSRPPYERFVELRKQREIILERRIMGDAYNSIATGKFVGRGHLQGLVKQAPAQIVLGPDETQIWPLYG
jgi:hypothetical protein